MSIKREKPTMEERVARSKKNAAKELAKSGLIQIRMEPAVLEQIYELAAAKGVRYTTMVREWIVEKLEISDSNARPEPEGLQAKALYLALDEIRELKGRVMNLEHNEVREGALNASEVYLKSFSTTALLKELLTRDAPQSNTEIQKSK